MKILVDAYGGDNAPLSVVEGVIEAVTANENIEVALVGNQKELETLVKAKYQGNKISIINATDKIENEDVPTVAIRTKKDSSMVVALRTLRDNKDEYAGVVSAGSTGALLFGAITICRRIKGISRPCLAPIWPTVSESKMVVVDSGANADCKPINLQHFALMGSAFMTAMFDVKYPRIGILSNGAEEGKGNELTKETYELLSGMKNINFIGNAEARDILFNGFDVVVCDGFTGNIALKSVEGCAIAVMKMLKDAINKSGILTKIGALMMKPALRVLKRKMDVNEQGGGTLLGVDGIVVKAHGASSAKSFAKCVEQVAKLAENKIVENIKNSLQDLIGDEND